MKDWKQFSIKNILKKGCREGLINIFYNLIAIVYNFSKKNLLYNFKISKNNYKYYLIEEKFTAIPFLQCIKKFILTMKIILHKKLKEVS